MIQKKQLCFDLSAIQNQDQEGKDFFDFIRILLNQAQDIKIWSDGMYVSVEYDDSNQEYGGPILEWIDPSIEYIAEYDKEEDIEYNQDGGTEG